MRRTELVVALVVVLPACGEEASPPRPAAARTPAPATAFPATAAPTPTPTPRPLPPPIELGRLPDEGLIVMERGGLVFMDVTGAVVERVPHMAFAGNGGLTGIWTQRGRDYFRFDEARRRLVPVPRAAARDRMYEPDPEPDLRRPQGTWHHRSKRVVGHWRYAYEGPNGVVLAQWSGECETPTAYWKAPGEPPEIVTGGFDLGEAPSSFALGWTDDGGALVFLPMGSCGLTAPEPGIYRFTGPGAGELVYETTGYSGTRMWQ